jgi:hypothetical protein
MRLDLAATINGNLQAKKLNHSSFTATVYNVLGRKNPYSIFFKKDGRHALPHQIKRLKQICIHHSPPLK